MSAAIDENLNFHLAAALEILGHLKVNLAEKSVKIDDFSEISLHMGLSKIALEPRKEI